MKNKINLFYITLGIGIGIILTSCVFILNPKVEYKEYSNEQIINKAKELGMVSMKEKINLNKDKPQESQKQNSQKEKQEEEIKVIPFKIECDDTLSIIAGNLFEKGLIANKDDFIQFAKDRKVDKKLRTGSYELQKDFSYSKILKILSKEK